MHLNVLSLFDGISCGHAALERAGIHVDCYFASEIDKYAIRVTQNNYPDTIQLGDVRSVASEELPKIDLLIGGSPCTNFSTSGKMNGMTTTDNRKITSLEQYLTLKNDGASFSGQSYLFWEYVRLLRELKPKYFLLENVVMKKEWSNLITEAIGVDPVLIDAALVSAAVRRRLYWTNIPAIEQPKDRHITFGAVRERGVDDAKIYYTPSAIEWIKKHSERTGKKLRIIGDNEKMQMLEASMYKKYSAQRFFAIEDIHGLRYITVKECERCMGLPDGYTSGVSNMQAYKQLGNGWNVDTIAHIFSFLPKEDT